MLPGSATVTTTVGENFLVLNGYVSATNGQSSTGGAQCEYQVDGAAVGSVLVNVPSSSNDPGQIVLVGRTPVSPGTHTVQVACYGTTE